MRSIAWCVTILALSVAIGCGGASRPGEAGGAGGKSTADLKAELLATAKQMEGGNEVAVRAWVNSAENGTAWSTVDEQFGPGKFTPETTAAYQKWRAAKIAEDKAKKK